MEFPLDSISEVLETLGNGSKHAGQAVDLAKKFKSLFSDGKKPKEEDVRELILELTSEVQDAKEANIIMREQLLAIREAALDAQRQTAQFDRYALWKAPAGGIVYKLKDEFSADDPSHCICPNCRQKGVLTILQGDNYAHCKPCDIHFELVESNISSEVFEGSGWV